MELIVLIVEFVYFLFFIYFLMDSLACFLWICLIHYLDVIYIIELFFNYYD